jgi:hypothetical protein
MLEFEDQIVGRARDHERGEPAALRQIAQGADRDLPIQRQCALVEACRRRLPVVEHHRERGRPAVVFVGLPVQRNTVDCEPARLGFDLRWR